MKRTLYVLIFFFSLVSVSAQQVLNSEEMFRNYFETNKDSLDQIEGIWTVSTIQEFYHYDTLYEVVNDEKAARVAIMKKGERFESFNLTGESFDVSFSSTDVQGVYLYVNFFRETGQESRTQAVISKGGVMEYTYFFPEDYLKVRLADSYEEGTKVVNSVRWQKVFPYPDKK